MLDAPDLFCAPMSAHFTILGSGSSGNCAFLETSETRLLVDAGLSGRQIRNRLLGIGRTPEILHGILITHEHSDHIQGLAGLAAKLRIPVYCNRATREAIERQVGLELEFRLFETGASFEIGDVLVDTFTVPHDAYDPVGFVLHTESGKIGFLTDLGHATKLILQRLQSANILLLETNYDLGMLRDDHKRPWSVKQRIVSRHGHLSNEAAAGIVEQLLCGSLRHVFLGHLSSDCNHPNLARQAIDGRLQNAGAGHVRVDVASQDVSCPTLALG
jgi:phosphoribosyl 1,2-cyclic phosphodiesterase